MLVYGPVRPAAEGHQSASESRCRRLSTGRPGGREAQCPCMGFRPQLPALALQPSDTTCSHRRLQPLTCSALLSPGARLHRTPRGPRRIPPPPLPHYTHAPYTPHQPLIEVHSQPTYPAYYLREPRYGLPPPPPPDSPLLAVPPPDHGDLELAYLRGHVAGLDRRTEKPPPPKEAVQRAPPAPHGLAPDVVGEATPTLLVAPVRETMPREDRRPPAPTQAPRRPKGTTNRRSRSPRRDLRNDHRGHSRTSPSRDGRTAYRRPYRSPERYYERRSEERSSGH